MKSRCDSFGTLRRRADHKDLVKKLETAQEAGELKPPHYWQRQGRRTGPRCKSRFCGFWVPNVLVIILTRKSQPWTPWGPMSSSPPSSRNPGIPTPKTTNWCSCNWVVPCTTQIRTMSRYARRYPRRSHPRLGICLKCLTSSIFEIPKAWCRTCLTEHWKTFARRRWIRMGGGSWLSTKKWTPVFWIREGFDCLSCSCSFQCFSHNCAWDFSSKGLGSVFTLIFFSEFVGLHVRSGWQPQRVSFFKFSRERPIKSHTCRRPKRCRPSG